MMMRMTPRSTPEVPANNSPIDVPTTAHVTMLIGRPGRTYAGRCSCAWLVEETVASGAALTVSLSDITLISYLPRGHDITRILHRNQIHDIVVLSGDLRKRDTDDEHGTTDSDRAPRGRV